MKKLALTAVICSICLVLGEKAARAQFSIGAGYEYTQFSLDGEKHQQPFDGFTAEIGYTARFMRRMLGVNLGVSYSFGTRTNGYTTLGTQTTQEQAVTVPLRLVIDLPVNDFGIIVMGGGYGSYGISGVDCYDLDTPVGMVRVEHDYLNNRLTTSGEYTGDILDNIGIVIDESLYNRHDYGLLIGAGIRVRRSMMVGCELRRGLCNRFREASDGNLRRNSFNVKLSFLF